MPPLPSPHASAHSDEVKEIITEVPRWIVRWGTTVLFVVIVMFTVASWLIHYPDVVKAPFTLTSLQAPKPVIARIDGKLIRLLVREHSPVQQGDVLAYLESTADHRAVLALIERLDVLSRQVGRQEGNLTARRTVFAGDHLGELQNAYQAFDQAYTQYLSFQANGFYPVQRKLLTEELADLALLEGNLREQVSIYRQDWDLAQREYQVQQDLAEQKVIAVSQLRQEESKLLARRLPLKQAESAIVQNSSAQHAKRKEILALDKEAGEQRGLFVQALNTLRSEAQNWKQRYVLTAPVGGQVYFSRLLEEKQTLAANQEVFFIAPRIGNYFGEVWVPQQNLGKVRAGQRVLIKFDSYPFQEYGTVAGRIAYLSEIPSKQDVFLAKVDLPDGLRTNYGKSIAYKSGIKASAEIITTDQRLLERLFYNFRRALSR